MSPSDLDTKAKSVPPHAFKVGDKVRLKTCPEATFTVLPFDHDTGRIPIVGGLKDEPYRITWDVASNLEFVPGANEVKSEPVKLANIEYQPDKERWKAAADAVNHPSHYTAGTLETIDAIEAMVGQAGWSPATGYRLGNVLKYIWRHAHKGGLESLKKARWYLDREIAACEKKP